MALIHRDMELADMSSYLELMKVIFPTEEQSERDYELSIGNDFSGLFIDNKVVGNLLMRHYTGNTHLHNIGVHPDYQGKGYGSKLMEIAMERSKSNKSKYVVLYVETNNTPAISLYKKFNFRIISESWHFILDISRFKENHHPSIEGYKIRPVSLSDLDLLEKSFSSLNIVQVKEWISNANETGSTSNQFLALHKNAELKIFVRFNAKYSGCMPFKIKNVEDLDPFIRLMIQDYIQSDRDILHLTFDDHKEVANLLNSRDEKLFHHLYKMQVDVE